MPVSDYIPAVQDVARILRARTRDQYGNELGTFVNAVVDGDPVTSPTADEAAALIAEAADEVSEAVGADLSPDLISPAKRLVTLLAAANVEMSYYPEQAAAGNSMYDKLMARYNTLLTRLEADQAEETESSYEDENWLSPTGDFPESSNWGTVSW